MATTAQGRTPVHLWIVGILSLLWGCMGAYDYVMTRMHNLAYFKTMMPNADPTTVYAFLDGMPIYASIGWGLGVWGGLLGAVLLLVRSRYAVWAYAASFVGMLLSFGWQLFVATNVPAAMSNPVVPAVVTVIGIFTLWYSWSMENKGVLR